VRRSLVAWLWLAGMALLTTGFGFVVLVGSIIAARLRRDQGGALAHHEIDVMAGG
jgi:hypothetical protein